MPVSGPTLSYLIRIKSVMIQKGRVRTTTVFPNYQPTVFPGFVESDYTGEGKGGLIPSTKLKSGDKDRLSLLKQNLFYPLKM